METGQPSTVLRPLLASLLALTAWAAAAGPKSQPSTKPTGGKPKVVFPLAEAIKQPVPKYSLEQLARMFPAFQHEPFETAGFNHFTLPFLYESRDNTGDRHEAYAFSFLLSASLDWAPGCYCTRHAYFAFKRARRYVVKLTKEYDAPLIRWAIKDWEATHAVGGRLVRSKAGYAGKLVIFNAAGRRALEKEYKEPRGFFDLLGEMCVDAMKFFGHSASPALVKHLHWKRCKHPESITDLGKAAFVKERSEEEFAIYKKILTRDPGFADVRYWWANQGYWRSSDRRHYAYQMALAMDSYLIEPIIWDFDPSECPSKELAAKHPLWMKRAQELVGPDFPGLLKAQMRRAREKSQVPAQLLVRLTRTASRYPNSYWFLYDLERLYSQGGVVPSDPAMSISICIAALRNRYMTGTGHKRDVAEDLALRLEDLGYNGMAVQIAMPTFQGRLQSRDRSSAAWCAFLIGRSLAKMGQYAESVKWYRFAFKNSDERDPTRNRILVEAGIAAALAGRDDILAQILRDRRKEAAQAKMLSLLEAYRDALAGKCIDLQAVRKKVNPDSLWGHRQEKLFSAQIDLLAGRRRQWGHLHGWLKRNPCDRRFWIVYDAYDRKSPRPFAGCFYDALQWLYGHDPWVRKAAADFRVRSARAKEKSTVPSAAAMLALLKDFDPIRWTKADPSARDLANKVFEALHPGAVAVGVRDLLGKTDFDRAEELARRYLHLAVALADLNMRAYGNFLIRRVEQARRDAKERAKHDDL